MWISVPKVRKPPPGGAKITGGMEIRTRTGFSSLNNRQSTKLRNRFQRGQAMLEILIVLLILIPLIFGGIELSRGVAVRSSLDSGVGVAVQALSIDPTQWGFAGTVVQQAVDQNVFGSAGLDPFVHLEARDFNDLPIGDLTVLPYGAPFCIVGSVGYSAMVPLLPSLMPITIRVRHCGIIQRIIEGT